MKQIAHLYLLPFKDAIEEDIDHSAAFLLMMFDVRIVLCLSCNLCVEEVLEAVKGAENFIFRQITAKRLLLKDAMKIEIIQIIIVFTNLLNFRSERICREEHHMAENARVCRMMLKKDLPGLKVQIRKIRSCTAADVSFQIIGQSLKAFFQTGQIETVLGFKIMVDDSLGNAPVLADGIDRCSFRSVF